MFYFFKKTQCDYVAEKPEKIFDCEDAMAQFWFCLISVAQLGLLITAIVLHRRNSPIIRNVEEYIDRNVFRI